MNNKCIQINGFKLLVFFGILGFIWQYTRKVPEYLWSRIKRKILYTAAIEETDEFFNYFEQWLNKNHKKNYRNVEVSVQPSYLDEQKNNGEEIRLKQFEDLFFIRRGFNYIKIWKGREKIENANKLSNVYFNRFKLSAIGGKKIINELLEEVLQEKIEFDKINNEDKVRVWLNDGQYWNSLNNFKPKPINDIVNSKKDEIINDVEYFVNNQQWYDDRNIKYRRGYLFFGPPGTGKTTLALGLSVHLSKDVFVLNPADLKDNELISLFRNMYPNSILLIEDVDAIFNKDRQTNDEKYKFSFSTLLNCLDGTFTKSGIITIFTTNHIENLDPALIRDGRIDVKMNIDYANEKDIYTYLERFYNIDEIKVHLGYKTRTNIPMAELQEICIKNKQNIDKTLKLISMKV